ncbi:BON domain-containing protein [Methylobacterium goesingense]|nr:BON domain-containing protein [Methylobacterium goesingense]
MPSGSDVSAASVLRDRCRRLGWAAGLPGLALILGLSAAWITPRFETQLGVEADAIARATAAAGAEPWLRVAVDGRDLLVTGEAPDAATRDAAHRRLAAIEGVRRVVGPVGVVELASPFVWIATRERDGVALTGVRPAEIGAGALAEQLTPALEPGMVLRDRARAALGAPTDFATAAAYALARLRALAPGGRVMLEDTRLSVVGEAASIADDAAVRSALTDLPTGYNLGRIEILPAIVPDFRFVVMREPGGAVTLSGHVVSESVRAEIRAQAAQVSETGQVEDRMRNARGLPADVNAGAMARFVLQLAALIQEGSVGVADGRVAVNGVALDAQAIPEIEALLRDGMPAGLGRGGTALTTRPLSPYRVALRRDVEAVTVTGHLPDAETREILLGTLRPRLFRERLIDRTRLGEGAPHELARVLRSTATALALLARGEAQIADRSLTLTGESPYAQGSRRISDDLSSAMPPGWTAEVAVTTPDAAPARTPEACAAAIEGRLAAGQPLVFPPGSTTLKPAFYPLLDGIAALGKTCPTLRLVITGHLDPTGAAAPKPVAETAVESTASLETSKDATKDSAKASIKSSGDKASGKTASKDKAAKPEPKPAMPTEPAPDLAQVRALAIVEYLLQAGLRPEQVTVAPPGLQRPPGQGVGIAARS